MSNALTPCKDRILVRQEDAEEKSKGGILIPEQTRKKPGKGKVLAVGKDVEEVKEGDVVLFNRYDVSKLEIEGAELAVLSEENVLLRLGSVED